MARKPFDRSPEFAGRLQNVLARANVPRQRVARHLEKTYGTPDFRAWEGKLVRYCAGLVPPRHDLEAIFRSLVWPREKLPEVMRWLLEGGDAPEFTLTLDESPGQSTMRVGPVGRAAEPLSSDPLEGVLRAFKSDRLTLEEVRGAIVGLSKSGLLDAASRPTSSFSCRSTPTPRSSKLGRIVKFPTLKRLSGGVAK